ncbi:MAG: discoidin domain-containing protein, partial [Bifidobacteriaceae bacterium]|nr:discoidin domain-containing protein [Bifidobacteriaceae bacterium]
MAIAVALIGALPGPAFATDPILPGNESDVGVYTSGAAHTQDIGSPAYSNVDTVQAALDPGVAWNPGGSMYSDIFQDDLAKFDQRIAAGQAPFYLDRILGYTGDNSGLRILQTRGRSLYMRGSSTTNFTTMGFAGTAAGGGNTSFGNLYSITVTGKTVAEQNAYRFNAPSYMSDRYNLTQSGQTTLTADLKKFITYNNVAVTTITFNNPGTEDVSITVRATSSNALTAVEGKTDEMRGTITMTGSGGNIQGTTYWGTGTVAVTVPGSAKSGNYLDKVLTIPAGGSVDYMAVGGYWHSELPESEPEFYQYAAMTPADAFKAGTRAFNERWASDIPYIDVPSTAIEKAIVYRWWLERYDSLDAAVPGYVYQYPVTIEGVNLYYNAVVLTQPMHLQDTKWQRTPYLGYGQIMNVGELSGSSAFLDSPGHGSWNNHYSQYIGTAGLEAYAVHGGGTELAQRFATYFEGDGVGQLEHYDGNGNNLIAYTANYMPGNDADALTFGYTKSGTSTAGSSNIERPESAYVWGDFNAAAKLYALAGASQAKVTEMETKANTIKDAILTNLWSPGMKMFVATTTRGRTAAASMNSNPNPLAESEPTHIPVRESNLYDVYAQNLIDPADWATYVDGFRFLTYGDNFPIYPFYTANQYDRTRYNIGGSNNFSNINFTVQYRGVRSALRYYDPNEKYITGEYAAQLLDWMAYSIYLVSSAQGNLLQVNQPEYFSNYSATTKSATRNNPYHVALGNMNYIYVEDMGGIQPRTDDIIELWPIDLGYDYFMVNNLRYHNHDITIVWDKDGTHYNQGQGYSLWVDGVKKVNSDKLTHLQYDPNAGTATNITTGAQTDPTATVTVVSAATIAFPTAVNTVIEDQRVVDYLKTAGIYLDRTNTPNLALGATVSSSTMQTTIPTSTRRAFHTPGSSTGAMNYDPGSISAQERPASLAAVNDNSTVNEPYWGNYGVSDQSGYVELDFGTAKTFDNVEVYFHDGLGLAGGAKVPLSYYVAIPSADSATGWAAIGTQAHEPKLPAMKQNTVLFDDVTASKVRLYFTNNPGYYTAIAEIQVFDSNQPVPVVVNDPPTVTASVNTAQNGNLSTQLTATVTDDGIPFDKGLTMGWSVVSAPAGASVVFADATAATTRVNGTKEGAYVFRFTASDGDLTTTVDVSATLTPKNSGNEWGALASNITTSYTASWENHSYVNNPSNPTSSNPGTGTGWGNWSNGASSSNPAWIQYTWSEPISITSSQIYWYSDGGGTRVPSATGYTIQYSMDGTTWTNVTLINGTTYAGGIATGTYNNFEFQPFVAQYLRIRITAITSSAAGTGVLRWRVYGPGVEEVDPPIKHRTTVGVIPTLPATHGVSYTDGTRGELAFEWAEITAADVAEVNTDPFSVWGVNATFDVLAEAQIYVRPADQQVVISSVDPMAETVFLGTQPTLPTHLSLFFNDGSADNDCVGVTWDYNPSVVNTVGVYQIHGTYTLPDWISPTNQPEVIFTLTVEGPEVLSVEVAPATATVAAGASQ